MTSRAARLRGVGLLVVTSLVLVIARWLDPDPSGHGTHTQLGLFPCTFYAWTGLPCPLCGATTSFALLADLRLVEGVRNQPFAAALFVVTVGVWWLGLAEAVAPAGRWERLGDAAERHDLQIAVGVLGGLLAGWIYKITIS